MVPARERNRDSMNREEFVTELDRLVAAHESGVQLVGGYDVRSPHRDTPDYTVEITKIRKKSPEGLWNE